MTRLAFGAKCGSPASPPVFGSRACVDPAAQQLRRRAATPSAATPMPLRRQAEQLPPGQVQIEFAFEGHGSVQQSASVSSSAGRGAPLASPARTP